MDDEVTELKNNAKKSVLWVYISNIVFKAMTLLTTIILAKILFPEDFGIIAIATAIIGFLQIAVGLGLSSAIIQRYSLNKEIISTCFFFVSATGILITVFTILIAPSIANFYATPSLAKVLQCLAITIFLSSLNLIPASLLERKLSFKQRCFSEIIPQICYALFAITLAYYGFGFMSIIIAQIIARALETIIVFIFQPLELVWKLDWTIFKEMFTFGREILVTGYLTYIILNFDNLFVGKLLGPAILGFYAFAYNAANFPATYIVNVIHRISFPYYSKMQKNLAALQTGFLKIFTFTLFFTLPLGFGLIFFGKYILISFFNDKWLPAVAALQILSCVGMLRAIGTNFSTFLVSIGKPKIVTNTTFLMIIIVSILIYPLTKMFGIAGTALTIIAAQIIPFFILVYYAVRFLQIPLKTLWNTAWIYIQTTAITFCLLLGIQIILFPHPSLLNSIFLIAIGGILYLPLIYLFSEKENNIFKDFMNTLKGGLQ